MLKLPKSVVVGLLLGTVGAQGDFQREFNEIMLKSHNDYRALHGAGPLVIDERAA